MDTFIPDAQQEPRLGNLKETAFFPEKVSAFALFRNHSGKRREKHRKQA